ncbi:hypothetical protein RD792_001059 [Penstemon davidsonii]|uniref:Uncharacterized protein n=1 Tax=Penstemon davidsonii TaxID=160366 RepID=A0ABR0DMC8_9LAMI|nr:hypothetical protein RD792_001059 [Penstemon davidsonii]
MGQVGPAMNGFYPTHPDPRIPNMCWCICNLSVYLCLVNLQVSAKRTNVPGMKQFRGRRFNPYMTVGFRRPYVPPYFYSPYGYG